MTERRVRLSRTYCSVRSVWCWRPRLPRRRRPPPPAADPPSPPTPEVTFKVEVNYVEEDVRVVDRDGNFVRGLKQEDFQVLEDGKPQKVQTFGMVDIPNTRPRKPLYLGPDALPIEPDVAVNKQVLDGRLYLIVLDDYHVAPLRSQNVTQPRAPLRAREARPRRSGGRRRHERAAARVAGLHAEPPAAGRGDRQLRRPEAAVVGRRAQREDVAPDGRQRARRPTMPAIPSRSIRPTGSSRTTAQRSACFRRARR